jgi:hypothetical protein
LREANCSAAFWAAIPLASSGFASPKITHVLSLPIFASLLGHFIKQLLLRTDRLQLQHTNRVNLGEHLVALLPEKAGSGLNVIPVQLAQRYPPAFVASVTVNALHLQEFKALPPLHGATVVQAIVALKRERMHVTMSKF